MQNFVDLLLGVWNQGLLGVSISQIIISLIILTTAFVLRGVISNIVIKWLENLTAKTDSKVDDIILDSLRKPLGYVPITIGLYLITIYLPLAGLIDLIATNIVKAFVVFTIFSVLANAVEPLFKFLAGNSWLTSAMSSWLEKSLKVLIWIIGFAVILDIFGIQIGPLIAGLGLFSVAIALGAQDLFKNLISGILVLVEKRFKIGDWIKVEGIIEGIVEKIGFRSTVIRKFDKSLAIIPNFQFAENAVINKSQKTNWLISWIITLQYDTTIEQLKTIRDKIEEYINNHEDFNTSVGVSVRVDKFSDSSIDMYVRCFTKTNKWSEHLEVKERLALSVKEIVEGNKAAFAFPSQSIYVEKK